MLDGGVVGVEIFHCLIFCSHSNLTEFFFNRPESKQTNKTSSLSYTDIKSHCRCTPQ